MCCGTEGVRRRKGGVKSRKDFYDIYLSKTLDLELTPGDTLSFEVKL